MKHPLTQRSFRAWLKGRPADEVVGYSAQTDSCPCATCIVDINPDLKGKPIAVLYDHTEIGPWTNPTAKIRNPRWLYRFTTAVDALGNGVPITAGRARRIFRESTHPATAF